MFTTDADFERPDWPLIQDGAVNLFWNPDILAETEAHLQPLGYRFAEVSCRDGIEAFRRQMADALAWEEQFGYLPWSGNLDALDEGFRGFPFGPGGHAALVLDGFHLLVEDDGTYAHAILDIIEQASRDHLLHGKILIGLVQTDDNRFACPAVGCRPVQWNPREWLDSNRSL